MSVVSSQPPRKCVRLAVRTHELLNRLAPASAYLHFRCDGKFLLFLISFFLFEQKEAVSLARFEVLLKRRGLNCHLAQVQERFSS